MKQPQTIELNGVVYSLTVPHKVVDESAGISEGPFYSQPLDKDTVYLPDAPFLLGISSKVSIMHPIRFPSGEAARRAAKSSRRRRQ